MKNDNDKHAQLMAQLQLQDAEALAKARADAHAAGKEPLDVALVERAWPDNPNAHYTAHGVTIPPERRLRDWERLYYLRCKDVRTIAEFVARLKVMQSEGYFD